MAKKPNAANITHGLAQLGGGSKKNGGEGMMGGMQNIFKKGVEYGMQQALSGKTADQILEITTTDDANDKS